MIVPLALSGCSSGTPTATSSQSPAPISSTASPEASDTGAPATAGTIILTTNRGDVTITTDPDAPKTVAAMTNLAQSGYFDNTVCHRLVTSGIYVLQCGDPTGTGTGGPGYTLPDENLPAASRGNYPAGTVAMANSGPNTAGSQFFLVYQDTTLPPGYTIWGEVTSGLDVVRRIAAAGTADGAPDGAPKKPITIESTTTSAS